MIVYNLFQDNNFHFNQVFFSTLDSKQVLSFLHLNNISANISEKSLSILLAKASFAFLLISMLSYWFQMSFKSSTKIDCKIIYPEGMDVVIKNNYNKTDRKNFFEKVPLISMCSANITLAFLLSIRWIESGHFPLSNLYESLLFLSWSLTGIHLVLENLFYKREHILCSTPTLTLGAITSPVALFTNAFATFSLPQEMQKVTVLVPALKSNWLIMHVSVMIISYAALLSGSLLAMAFLVIKFIDDNKVNISQIFLLRENPLVTRYLVLLRSKGVKKYKNEYIPSGNPSIMSTFINYISSLTQLINTGFVFIRNKNLIALRAIPPAIARVVSPTVARVNSYSSSSISSASFTPKEYTKASFLGYEKSEAKESKPLLLKSFTKENKVLIDLPQILDNLSYRSIGFGFALLTIGILSGAVWANEAWGSYWSWDPKETWAFITWLVFALYLHTRLSKGWVGKESAFVASFGFIVIWFCYLGVNLFGKGLHSYGWFQQ